MGYAKEFNFSDYIVPAVIQSYKWDDVSWRNDVCPLFENKELQLAVWVDCTDPEQREYEDWKQYTVVETIKLNSEETTLGDDYLFATESMDSLTKWLTLYEARLDANKALHLLNTSDATYEDVVDELVTAITMMSEQMAELK